MKTRFRIIAAVPAWTVSRALVWLLVLMVAWPHTAGAASHSSAAASPSVVAESPDSALDEQHLPPTVELCTFNEPCVTYAPPPLLNLDEGANGAAGEQRDSLRRMEAKAIADVLALHSLPDSDAAAVKSWGRFDVLADLYSVIVSAISTSAAERTTDQQNALDWVSAAAQQQASAAAQSAALEYVKWAGLDRSDFAALLGRGAGETELRNFLAQAPTAYNNTITGGYCVYASPSPYESDYKGRTHQTCFTPCADFLGCPPPTPSYDEFVKWGQAAATAPFLNSDQFRRTSEQLAIAVGAGLAAAAAIPLATLPPALLIGVPTAAVVAEWAAEGGVVALASVSPFMQAVSGLAAFAAVVAIVLAAITIAIMKGISVIGAAELPGQLAKLVVAARTDAVDATTLLTDTEGATTLYTIFVSATLPEPIFATCDNAGGLPQGVTFTGDFYFALTGTRTCLNPTAIAPASAIDPQFIVKQSGGTIETTSPTISYSDHDGVATTTRLVRTWFVNTVNGATTQSLAMHYVDWNGKKQNAWLIGSSDRGFAFLTFTPPTDATTTLSPDTCVSAGLCSAGSSINYLGSNGRLYTASVRGYTPAIGTPKYTVGVSGAVGVEGAEVSFGANGFTLSDAVGPVVHTWQFQKGGCFSGNTPCTVPDPITHLQSPDYSDPLTGDDVKHTFTLAGKYLVKLTATDSRKVSAAMEFPVVVENVAPTLTVRPACPSIDVRPGALCDQRTVFRGDAVQVIGSFKDPGAKSTLAVTVNWGDGSSDSKCISPDAPCIANSANPLELAKNNTIAPSYKFTAPHTYAAPGTYYGTVSVADQFGGADSETFTITVRKTAQQVRFTNSTQEQVYGDFPFTAQASGGASGMPVTFAVTGDASVCSLVNPKTSGANAIVGVIILKAGTCTITASQAGTAEYEAAPPVTRSNVIRPLHLLVTASSATMTYGAAVPAITPSFGRFAYTDGPASLDIPPSCSAAIPPGGNVGTYDTTCSGAADGSYVIDYATGTLTVNKADSALSLAAAAGTPVTGEPVSITAAVAVLAPGSGKPAGTVTFKDGATVLAACSAVPVVSVTGVATCTTPFAVGPHSITASYSGDGNVNGSVTSAALTKTVVKASTTTAASASPTPSVSGKPATFTAVVSVVAPGVGAPTGTMTFFDGTTRLGTGTVSVVGGKLQGTLTTSALAIGHHAITATYAGDAAFLTSTSAVLTHYVNTDLSGFPRLASGAYNLSGVNMRSAYLVGVSLAGARIDNSNFESAVLIGANLSGATITGSNFKNVNFTGANLTGTTFTNTNTKDAIGLPAGR